MSSALPPSSIQEGALIVTFNNLLTEMFLFGIYTVVYLETLYIYLTKKESRQWIIICAISLLYIVFVIETGVQWVFNKRAFIANGSTQETVFISAVVVPSWDTLITDICGMFQAALADGLLIWRCFNVWNGSLRVIAVPSFLLFSETAIYLTIIVTACVEHLTPSTSQAHALNNLTGAALFLTFGTSLLTTLLISYRIYSFTKQDIQLRSRAHFKNILEILIQSAAAYAMITVASAIASFFPLTNSNFVSLFAAQTFTSTFYAFIAGVAPTIMVARVAFANDANNDTAVIAPALSGLRFGVRSVGRNATQSGDDNSDTRNGEHQLVQESVSLNEKQEGSSPSA